MGEHGRDFVSKEMRHTILKLVILHKASCGKVYPYSLIKSIRFGLFASMPKGSLKNDIYNTVKALEGSGLIKVSGRSGDGRVKTYYTITRSGSAALAKASKIRAEFIHRTADLFR